MLEKAEEEEIRGGDVDWQGEASFSGKKERTAAETFKFAIRRLCIDIASLGGRGGNSGIEKEEGGGDVRINGGVGKMAYGEKEVKCGSVEKCWLQFCLLLSF